MKNEKMHKIDFTPYIFTADWFTSNIPNWERFVKKYLQSKNKLKFLDFYRGQYKLLFKKYQVGIMKVQD